ncbi:MAG TPA: hypothetical protein VN976_21890 [Verrucomicrobiae bacterium]|nr:hypothetical protein [Verrucomicrobiae bacterium]
MRKNITGVWILAVFLASIALSLLLMPTGAQTPTPVYPVIKANVEYQNQTSTIPATALFTPPADGTYRISAYMDWMPGDNVWAENFNLSWTDDFQAYCSGCATQVSFGTGIGGYNGFAGVASVARVKANTPISFDVESISGTPGPYNLYIVIEKLKPLS